MNRWLSFLFFVMILGSTALAQQVSYTPYEKFDFQTGDFSPIGIINGRLYTYRGSSNGFFLDAYDDSMNKLATIVLDFFPQKIYQTRFISYSDHIVVLYQSLESNKVIQYAALLDASGRLKKGPLQLDSKKTGILGATKTYFSSVVSEDKKNIVVYSAEDKGSRFILNAKWIDDQLNIVKHTHAVYEADNDIEHEAPVVSNDGNMYIPLCTPIGGRNFSDRFLLLSINGTSTAFVSKELPLNSLYIGNVYIKMDEVNKRVYLGGFYSTKKNGNNDGVIYAYYDVAANMFQNRKTVLFDMQMLNASGKHNQKRAYNDYIVRHLIVKNDGGFVLVAESYNIVTRSNYMPGFGYYASYYSPYSASTIREYHYDDIMAISYNSEGVREWYSFIPKEQYSQEDDGIFSSFSLLNTGGTLAFMYNDFNVNNSRIQLATLDAQGKLGMRSFTPAGNDVPDWLPRAGKQVASRAIVIPCLHKRQICFAKVVF